MRESLALRGMFLDHPKVLRSIFWCSDLHLFISDARDCFSRRIRSLNPRLFPIYIGQLLRSTLAIPKSYGQSFRELRRERGSQRVYNTSSGK